MADYTRTDAAQRAGIEPTGLDRLIELGIVQPTASDRITNGGIRRAQIAHSLEQAGLPLEGLGSALKDQRLTLDFIDSPIYERFAAMSTESFRQLSERTGLPLDLLMLIREATGSAAPDPDDPVRDDELAVVPFIAAQLAIGYGTPAIERGLRVVGDSLRRVAETEGNAWHAELEVPILARGGTAADLTVLSKSAEAQRLSETGDQALMALWHAHQAHSWTANILTGFEHVLTEAGLFAKLPRPPAMCFLDITGYTRLTQERGDEAAAGLAEQLGRLVSRTSIEHGGRPVKWLGDGVMLYFRDPGPGVVAALDMVEGVATAGLPPAHVGLHSGPVLFQEGDYFGQTVNLASRIAEYARPGEVLVSQAVVEAAADAAAVFIEIGRVDLKGVAEAVHLHAAHRPG